MRVGNQANLGWYEYFLSIVNSIIAYIAKWVYKNDKISVRKILTKYLAKWVKKI